MAKSDNAEKKVDIEIKCPRCGKKINNYTCNFCGYMLDEHYGLCPNCEMQVFDDEKKCSNCGTLLDWDVEELKTNKTICFCCGKDIDVNTEICPKCGADLTQLDISESRNPYTKKYLMRDGSVTEGNGWLICGALALIVGFLMTLSSAIFGADIPSIIIGVIILCIGIVCSIYGSYKAHKGKIIVRKENDKIRESNPKFKSKEDQKDIWDKLKILTKSKAKNINISNQLSNKTNQLSMYEELKKLKSLLDDNLLTQSEFDEAKKALLKKYQKDIN